MEEPAPGSAAQRGFVSTRKAPVAALPLRPVPEAFARIENEILAGRRPAAAEIAVEGLINYFAYDYPEPEPDQPLGLILEAAHCPWEPGDQLVRVALKTGESAPALPVVAAEVRFNPAQVESYRLLGYDRDEGPGEAPTVPAGFRLTVLYQIRPLRGATAATGPLLQFHLSYRTARGLVASMEQALAGPGPEFDKASADLRLAAAAARFGLLLRAEEPMEPGALADLLAWLPARAGNDERLARFVEVVRRADQPEN